MSIYAEKYGLPEDFDPVFQGCNFSTYHGEQFIVFDDFDWYYSFSTKSSIITGATVGMTGMAIIWMFLLSTPAKRRSLSFILNMIALFSILIKSLLIISCQLCTTYKPSYQFLLFPEMPSKRVLNLVAISCMFSAFQISAIELSIFYQTYLMFSTNPGGRRFWRIVVITFAAAMCLFVAATYVYSNIKVVVDLYRNVSEEYFNLFLNIVPILFASSVNFMSFLSIGKLVFAIKTRRYLGMKQFDVLHILVIMLTQCMIIPSVLLILSYSVESLSYVYVDHLAICIVGLTLPLSQLWASAAIRGSAQDPSYPHSISQHNGSVESSMIEKVKMRLFYQSESDDKNAKPLDTSSTMNDENFSSYWMARTSSTRRNRASDESFTHVDLTTEAPQINVHPPQEKEITEDALSAFDYCDSKEGPDSPTEYLKRTVVTKKVDGYL